MVDHQIDDHLQSPVPCRVGELDEVPEIAEPRIDAVVICYVVAVVAVRRGVEWQEPDAGRPECLDVVEAIGEALKVAYSVAIGVEECVYVHAVDDGILVPKIQHRAPCGPDSDQRARRPIRAVFIALRMDVGCRLHTLPMVAGSVQF